MDGEVPGPGLTTGTGPNRVWGHPEMNAPRLMRDVRKNRLSSLSLTPFGLQRHGQFQWLGLAFNVSLVGAAWPVVWILVRKVRTENENRQRFTQYSNGARVRLRDGEFRDTIGIVEGVEIEKGFIAVQIEVSGQPVVVHVQPEEICSV